MCQLNKVHLYPITRHYEAPYDSTFLPSAISLALIVSHSALADYASLETYQGNPATEHTKSANQELAKQLPWQDVSAFERTKKGLIAEFGSHQAGELKSALITWRR